MRVPHRTGRQDRQTDRTDIQADTGRYRQTERSSVCQHVRCASVYVCARKRDKKQERKNCTKKERKNCTKKESKKERKKERMKKKKKKERKQERERERDDHVTQSHQTQRTHKANSQAQTVIRDDIAAAADKDLTSE